MKTELGQKNDVLTSPYIISLSLGHTKTPDKTAHSSESDTLVPTEMFSI